MIRSRWTATIVPILWWCTFASAHGMDADYTVVPDGFRIEFFFITDGMPAPDLTVTAEPEQGDPIVIGTTDAKGVVFFRPPSGGTWTVVGKGTGHSNVRDPVVIPAERVAEFLGARSVTPPSALGGQVGPTNTAVAATALNENQVVPQAANDAPSKRRGAWPWQETLVSIGFIAALTVATLWFMRRSADRMSKAHDAAHLDREVAELRDQLESLKREVEAMKVHDRPGA